MSEQQVITKADADKHVEETRALGLERRIDERHTLRMQWYRGFVGRQVFYVAVSFAVFVSIIVAVNFVQDLQVVALASVAAGAVLVAINLFGVGAQPPEER